MRKTYSDVYNEIMESSQAENFNELVNEFLEYAINCDDMMLKSEILEHEAYSVRQYAKYTSLGARPILLNKKNLY